METYTHAHGHTYTHTIIFEELENMQEMLDFK